MKIQTWNGSGFIYSEVKKADASDNADKVDQAHAGNSPGEVLLLDNTGKVPLANIPDGIATTITDGTVDGGSASAVFTPSQVLDGGNANG